MRFAHPVLLERARAAELATAAHPVLEDGPSVLTLLETVTTALVSRGLDPDETQWDAWRNEDSRWTVQVGWKAGRSDNVAHFRYVPGRARRHRHRGRRPRQRADRSALRAAAAPVAPVAQLDFDIPDMIVIAEPKPKPEPEPEPAAGARTGARRNPARARRAPSTPSGTQRQARAAGRAGVGGRAARGAVQRRPLTNPVALQRPGGSQRQQRDPRHRRPRRRRPAQTSAPPVFSAIPTPSAPDRRQRRG